MTGPGMLHWNLLLKEGKELKTAVAGFTKVSDPNLKLVNNNMITAYIRSVKSCLVKANALQIN